MDYKILCVICVRGGSLRLPHKNMQIYRGKTLVQHAIDRAMESKHIDKIVFGTEDQKIMKHVKKIRDNIQVKDWHPERTTKLEFETYKLSEEITQPHVSLYEPVGQILRENDEYDLLVILQADNPAGEGIIDRCIEKFFEMDKKTKDEKQTDDRQYFEEVSTFHDNIRTGTVRVITRDAFFSRFPPSKTAIIEDRPNYIDIQYPEDLKKANELYQPHDTFWIKNKIKTPIQYNTHMIYNHFNRYMFAIHNLPVTKGDTVIDASCGQGYGSFILSLFAGRVFGLDVNADYLRTAKSYYKTENLSFSSYETYYLYGDQVDKIVFIETYEHIEKEEIKSYLGDLLDCLKKGGDMFLAAPIGKDGPCEYNPHHLNEPSLRTLYMTFKPRFRKMNVTIDEFTSSFGKNAEYCLMCLYDFKRS